MELSSIVLQQVIIVVLLMVIGFVAKKTKILREEGIAQFTSFLLYFVNPSVLIEAYQKPFEKERAKLLVIAFLMAVLIHTVAILLSNFVFPVKKSEDNRINRFATVYSNCGFMAIPLLDAALGSEGVFFGSAYLAVFSILQWTHGIYICTGDIKTLSLKKAFFTPGILGVIAGIILFLGNITLPDLVGQTVGFIADLNTPLSMVILGTFLTDIRPKEIIKNKAFYEVNVIRLILIPIISIYLLKLLGIDSEVTKALVISASCPVAGATTLWAARYNLNAGYASQLVAITTVLSVFSIPAVLLLL